MEDIIPVWLLGEWELSKREVELCAHLAYLPAQETLSRDFHLLDIRLLFNGPQVAVLVEGFVNHKRERFAVGVNEFLLGFCEARFEVLSCYSVVGTVSELKNVRRWNSEHR